MIATGFVGAASDIPKAWTLLLGNRGHFLEPVVLRNLINGGVIDASRFRGMGARLNGIEGDGVEELASGLCRFIDVKAYNANFDLGEPEKIYKALTAPDTRVGEVIFGLEDTARPRQEWFDALETANKKIDALNIDQGRNIPRIGTKNGGSF
jgi:hypothetical protein